MTKQEVESEIERLLYKPPSPQKIQSIQAVRAFKKLVDEAKKAKSAAKQQEALNRLKGFYE